MSIFNKDSLKYTATKISTSAIDTAGSVVKITKDGASTVVKKSSNLFELSKLKSCISDETTKIDQLYMEIGKEIYTKYTEDAYTNEKIIELCSTIKDKEATIFAIKERILDLKNIVMCPKCNAKLKNNISFCPFCGANLAKNLYICVDDLTKNKDSIVTPGK